MFFVEATTGKRFSETMFECSQCLSLGICILSSLARHFQSTLIPSG